mgnify:CR=1 FL=1
MVRAMLREVVPAGLLDGRRATPHWAMADELSRRSPTVTVEVVRIFVRDGSAVLPLLLADIERIEAQDDYVMIHTQRKRYLVSLRIRDLENRLPNPPFLRVHRSHIVNLDQVDRLAGLDDARFEVRMKNGALVPVSRARSQEIRRLSR